MAFKHESWTSSKTFMLAAVGAAVGLGNIWRFPYMAGSNGGGAFVLIYLAAVVLIAIPVLMAESMIGRHGHMSAPVSMAKAAEEVGASRNWAVVGWFGVAAAFLILSFYSVIGGWVLAYVPKTISGTFTGMSSDAVSADFNTLLGNAETAVFWHTVFIAVTVGVVMHGIKSGIERAVGIMMPALFVMLLLIVAYAIAAGNIKAGLAFMFAPDFSVITADVILAAIGQAFFSIGVGIGIMFTYGAYLPNNIPLPRACLMIAGADTLVAVLAGIAIFPIVFANGLDAAFGPGLVFVTLPLAFGQMTGGAIIGTAFFVLLAFAALTSAISLLEVPVSWLEERKGWTRRSATLAIGGAIWLVGLGSALSTNVWADVRLLGMFDKFKDTGILDLVDDITGQALLPLGGMLIALFAGWWMESSVLTEELGISETSFKAWRILVRFVCPVGIGWVLASAWF
ncbi:MAG: sodium-dependent transporter [Rhodospirillaceae bacterium]|jgi:neurotransmitter:Na+ symporter, NSS family|nr:sodium-dependent transporter [Rhodospirillaceae bacterium]